MNRIALLRRYPRRASRAAPTKNLHHFLEQPQRPDPGRETQRSAAQIQVVHSIRHVWHNAAMAHPRKSHEHDSTNGAVPGGRSDKDASDNPIDPRAFGLAKAAYGSGRHLTCSVSVALRSTKRSNEATSSALSSARRRCFKLATLPRF